MDFSSSFFGHGLSDFDDHLSSGHLMSYNPVPSPSTQYFPSQAPFLPSPLLPTSSLTSSVSSMPPQEANLTSIPNQNFFDANLQPKITKRKERDNLMETAETLATSRNQSFHSLLPENVVPPPKRQAIGNETKPEQAIVPVLATTATQSDKGKKKKLDVPEVTNDKKLKKILAHRQSDLNRRVRMTQLYQNLETLVYENSDGAGKGQRTQSQILEQSVTALQKLQHEVAELKMKCSSSDALIDQFRETQDQLIVSLQTVSYFHPTAVPRPIASALAQFASAGTAPGSGIHLDVAAGDLSRLRQFAEINNLDSGSLFSFATAQLHSSHRYVELYYNKMYVDKNGRRIPVGVQTILLPDHTGRLSAVIARIQPKTNVNTDQHRLLEDGLFPHSKLSGLQTMRSEPTNSFPNVDEDGQPIFEPADGLLVARIRPRTNNEQKADFSSLSGYEMDLQFVDTFLCNLLGYSRAELESRRTVRDISAPEDGDRLLETLKVAQPSATALLPVPETDTPSALPAPLPL